MAHTCPDCYSICFCNGDIDDIDFGEDLSCDHCLPIKIKCAKCGQMFEIEYHKRDIEGLAWCYECAPYDEEE